MMCVVCVCGKYFLMNTFDAEGNCGGGGERQLVDSSNVKLKQSQASGGGPRASDMVTTTSEIPNKTTYIYSNSNR